MIDSRNVKSGALLLVQYIVAALFAVISMIFMPLTLGEMPMLAALTCLLSGVFYGGWLPEFSWALAAIANMGWPVTAFWALAGPDRLDPVQYLYVGMPVLAAASAIVTSGFAWKEGAARTSDSDK